MAMAQSEFADRSVADRSKPQRGRTPGTGRRGGVHLALGVAAILAVAVLGTLGGKPAGPTPESGTDDARAAAVESQKARAFDGRGKWSGYAR